MIAFLRGKPVGTGTDYVIIDVGGIGYKVFVPTPVIGKMVNPDLDITLYTYMHVREDAILLFGCLTEDDLKIFEHLIQVSGVGPKVALAVLSSMSAAHFIQAVASDEVDTLTRVPGVGKKTAQRMLIELKDKLAKMDISTESIPAGRVFAQPNTADDAIQALTALGYNPVEAKRAISKIDFGQPGSLTTEQVLKMALKELARL